MPRQSARSKSGRTRANTRGDRSDIRELSQALMENGRASEAPTKRKKWSIHDLKHIRALTPMQEDMFQDFFAGNNIIAHGSAGTGKTYIASFLALTEYLRHEADIGQIFIIRSAVPTRDVGFLPGSIEEKAEQYELPYKDIFADLLGKSNSYDDMKEAGIVKFCTTSYLRGLTWDNAIIIVDEAQSMTFHELNTIMTRVGKNCRIMVCGDLNQNDLNGKNGKSGFGEFLHVASAMRGFSSIQFTSNDIVRSDFVKSWIAACEANGM
jgi:phosphate starvation-inducible protein PhoH